MTSPVLPGAGVTCFDPRPPGPEECRYEAPACSADREDAEPLSSEHVVPSGPRVGDAGDAKGRARDQGGPSAGGEPDRPLTRPSLAEPWGLRFCRNADTVIEGFLCNEPLVVSNACRKPTNAFDAYVCDEPRMQGLQRSIVRETLSVVKALLFEWIGR